MGLVFFAQYAIVLMIPKTVTSVPAFKIMLTTVVAVAAGMPRVPATWMIVVNMLNPS